MYYNCKTAGRNSNQTSKLKHMCRNCKTACRNSNQTQVKQTICDITVKLLVETLI